MTNLAVEVDAAAAGFDPRRLSELDAFLARYVDDGKFPGWSLLISRRGQIAHLSRYGRRDVEADLPVEYDTVFRLHSMTKPVTTVAAMMLYEQGAFELTDPIHRFLPAFENMRVFSGGSDLRPETVPATGPIRMWHLLTHTSGLTYGFHHANPVDAIYRAAGFEWGTPPGLGLADMVDVFAGLPLVFQPGTEWNYSVSTDVLGRILEVICDAPLDQILHEKVIEPLGMVDTSFVVPESRRDRLAALYNPANGGMARNDMAGNGILAPSYLSGGGGLASTLGDYHRFTQMLLNRGHLGDVRLLGDRTVRYMTRNQLPGGADLGTIGRRAFAEAPFDGVGFGFGFAVTLDPVTVRTMGSPGEYAWGGAATTGFFVDPAEEMTIVFMTQLLPATTYPIRSQLKQLVYNALVD